MKNVNPRFLCVAPMMGYTTPHARFFYRLLTKKTYLFTEMIAAKTLIHSNKKKQVTQWCSNLNPVALQVGGSDATELAICGEIAEKLGFKEINLNIGCPSKAVQKGRFGVCLMKEKEVVKNCLSEIKKNSSIEVTMKCRLGVDNLDTYDFFRDFIDYTLESGITTIYIHARKAYLKGLSPKNNRNLPPLNYEFIYRIKEEFPNINFILNGGINSINDINKNIKNLDGVMLGRLVLKNPFILLDVDKTFFKYERKNNCKSQIIKKYFEYMRLNIEKDSIYRLCSPLLNMFFNQPNNKSIKKNINNYMQKKDLYNLESYILNL